MGNAEQVSHPFSSSNVGRADCVGGFRSLSPADSNARWRGRSVPGFTQHDPGAATTVFADQRFPVADTRARSQIRATGVLGEFCCDQAVGNFFTEFALASAFKQDPRYFTLGRGGFWKRSGYALSRLIVTRTNSGGSAINFSEIIGNGAAAGISGLYYPAQYRTWTKTGQRWEEQLALDAVFNVVKEFWPDISHSVLHQK
jgi:hypothetical protein